MFVLYCREFVQIKTPDERDGENDIGCFVFFTSANILPWW